MNLLDILDSSKWSQLSTSPFSVSSSSSSSSPSPSETSINVKVKPYNCQMCDKRFTDRFLLKKHEFTHTGLKPHKCPVCDRGFNRKDNLLRHRKLHSPPQTPPSDLSVQSPSSPVPDFTILNSVFPPSPFTPLTNLPEYANLANLQQTFMKKLEENIKLMLLAQLQSSTQSNLDVDDKS